MCVCKTSSYHAGMVFTPVILHALCAPQEGIGQSETVGMYASNASAAHTQTRTVLRRAPLAFEGIFSRVRVKPLATDASQEAHRMSAGCPHARFVRWVARRPIGTHLTAHVVLLESTPGRVAQRCVCNAQKRWQQADSAPSLLRNVCVQSELSWGLLLVYVSLVLVE